MRICPLDWETAAKGSATFDLAYLTQQRKKVVDPTRLIQAYMEGWVGAGGSPLSREKVGDMLRRSRIHQAMYAIWTAARRPGPWPERVMRYLDRAEDSFRRLP